MSQGNYTCIYHKTINTQVSTRMLFFFLLVHESGMVHVHV